MEVKVNKKVKIKLTKAAQVNGVPGGSVIEIDEFMLPSYQNLIDEVIEDQPKEAEAPKGDADPKGKAPKK